MTVYVLQVKYRASSGTRAVFVSLDEETANDEDLIKHMMETGQWAGVPPYYKITGWKILSWND